MINDYRAYGLNIRSELPFPELENATFDEPDVSIRHVPTAATFPPPDAPVVYDFTDERKHFLWPPVASITILGESVVDVEPAPDVNPRLLAFPILGPIMSTLLLMRGKLVLHGSAVAVGGKGVAFLGDKRAGKSTTSAAFVAAGHRLVTDDVLAVDFDDRGAAAFVPAFPQIKLSEAAAQAVTLADAELLPLIMPGFEKWQHRLSGAFDDRPVPAGRIFVLKRGPTIEAMLLPPTDALKALLRFSHSTKLGHQIFNPAAKALHMQQCAKLVRANRVYELQVPSSLDELPGVVRWTEEEIRGD